MVEKHDASRGAMVWPHHALVKIGECFPYVVMRAFHKMNHHPRKFHGFEGEITKIDGVGGSKFPLSFGHEFFSTMNIQPANHRVQIWHFSGFIYHI